MVVLAAGLSLGGCPFFDTDNQTAATNVPQDLIEQSLANTAPAASAGADQEVSVGAEVVISGTASSDGDGDQLSHIWRQVAGSPTVELRGQFSSILRFDAPDVTAPTILTFSLTVTDGFEADVDYVAIVVTPES
ncbi:MAG: PKD domain-containing protein [Planctomycetes bacterium]|nr:PKD domain-containing protein [Planctomycetota bacterium]